MNNFTKRFTMIDDSFCCEVCGKHVKSLGYTARDHCPHCLCSKHVDNNPGDRQNQCHGILKPTRIEPFKKGKYKIVYTCEKCRIVKRNVMAKDDNMDLIIQVMTNNIY